MNGEQVEIESRRSGKRRHWTTQEKRKIVEQTLGSPHSVAYLARQHGVNANQLFSWRKLYLSGQLNPTPAEHAPGVRLLPVAVTDEVPAAEPPGPPSVSSPNITINIELSGRALISVEGQVDVAIVRAVLESLRG